MREKIPGRLVMGLVAPFLIVGLFLWVFSKQSVPSKEKPELPDIASSTPLVSPILPETEQAQSPPLLADTTSVATSTMPKDVEKRIETSPPVNGGSSAPAPLIGVAKKNPQDKKRFGPKRATQEAKTLPVSVSDDKKERSSNKVAPVKKDQDVAVDPKVKAVTIREGRPKSPQEKGFLSHQGKESAPPPSPQPAKTPKSDQGQKNKKMSAPPQVAKSPVPPPSPGVKPPLPPPPSVQTVTGTSTLTPPQSTNDSSLPPSPSTTLRKKERYALQVGAFQKKEDAEALAFRLIERGYDTYIVVANVPNKGTWHRVRIGHYPDRSLAEKRGGEISNIEHLQFFITSD